MIINIINKILNKIITVSIFIILINSISCNQDNNIISSSRSSLIQRPAATLADGPSAQETGQSENAHRQRIEHDDFWYFQYVETLKQAVCRVMTPNGHGTGFGYKRDGESVYIMTAAHVVLNAADEIDNPVYIMYTIEPLDYQEEVQVIRYNKDLDMAMLRSAKSNLKWLNVFKAQSIGSFVNKAVLAIGYPQDIYPANVSLGFVMSISPDLIRTSAPQFFGNSGGPIILFGTSEVIGITQWITYMNGMPRSNQVFGHNYLAIHRFLIG